MRVDTPARGLRRKMIDRLAPIAAASTAASHGMAGNRSHRMPSGTRNANRRNTVYVNTGREVTHPVYVEPRGVQPGVLRGDWQFGHAGAGASAEA